MESKNNEDKGETTRISTGILPVSNPLPAKTTFNITYKQLLQALLVVALLIFITNQAMSYYYKNRFLSTPCVLCAELNPTLRNCFTASLSVITDSYGKVIYNTSSMFAPVNFSDVRLNFTNLK